MVHWPDVIAWKVLKPMCARRDTPMEAAMAKSSVMAKPLVGIVTCILFPAVGLAGDWPQWRGPNRDGVVHGVTVPAQWPKTLKEEWKVTVGDGYASPVVSGGKVYVFTRQQDDEV